MKIKNISDKEIKIPFKKSNGHQLVVSILPNQIMYGEKHTHENKQIVIYKRKGIIETSEDEKPATLEFYRNYSVLPHKEILQLKKAIPPPPEFILEETDEDDDDASVEIPDVTPSPGIVDEITDDDEEDIPLKKSEDEEDDDEDDDEETNNDAAEVVFNRGGRPKGAKNKSKRGRPKAKKKPGRPSKNKKAEVKSKVIPESETDNLPKISTEIKTIPNNF